MENKLLNLDSFHQTPLTTEPFSYLIVPNFIRNDALAAIHQDYPETTNAGSFPLDLLEYGPAFKALMDEIRGPELRAAIAEKFSMELNDYPTLVTVRGHADLGDGSIHHDTKSKLITVLLYMNPSWEDQGGRLRLLRDNKSLDNIVAEIPPVVGTLLVFKVSQNSWHGHKPFIGPRRVIQLNYVINQSVVDKEIARHHFSAKMKKLKRFIGL
jgi:hypothetical protein